MLHTSLILNSDMSYAMSDYAHKYSEVWPSGDWSQSSNNARIKSSASFSHSDII